MNLKEAITIIQNNAASDDERKNTILAALYKLKSIIHLFTAEGIDDFSRIEGLHPSLSISAAETFLEMRKADPKLDMNSTVKNIANSLKEDTNPWATLDRHRNTAMAKQTDNPIGNITDLKPYYQHITKTSKGRYHFFTVEGKDFSLSDELKALRGDQLKTTILMELKHEIAQMNDMEKLCKYINELLKDPRYEVLKYRQGVASSIFKRETSGVKAVDCMIKNAVKHINSEYKQTTRL